MFSKLIKMPPWVYGRHYQTFKTIAKPKPFLCFSLVSALCRLCLCCRRYLHLFRCLWSILHTPSPSSTLRQCRLCHRTFIYISTVIYVSAFIDPVTRHISQDRSNNIDKWFKISSSYKLFGETYINLQKMIIRKKKTKKKHKQNHCVSKPNTCFIFLG